jgi:hypothetical protein
MTPIGAVAGTEGCQRALVVRSPESQGAGGGEVPLGTQLLGQGPGAGQKWGCWYPARLSGPPSATLGRKSYPSLHLADEGSMR